MFLWRWQYWVYPGPFFLFGLFRSIVVRCASCYRRSQFEFFSAFAPTLLCHQRDSQLLWVVMLMFRERQTRTAEPIERRSVHLLFTGVVPALKYGTYRGSFNRIFHGIAIAADNYLLYLRMYTE